MEHRIDYSQESDVSLILLVPKIPAIMFIRNLFNFCSTLPNGHPEVPCGQGGEPDVEFLGLMHWSCAPRTKESRVVTLGSKHPAALGLSGGTKTHQVSNSLGIS